MDYIYEPALRTVIMYIVLLYLARVMGRKMISQMTFFDFVVGITVGAVAGSTSLGPYEELESGITVLVVLTILVFLIGILHIKSFTFRKIVDSEPVLVIAKGQIIDENLKRERFTIKELNALLRQRK